MATLGSLPIGAKIKVPHSVMGDIVFLKCDQNHEGYPENSTTLITDELILLRTFDAKEPNNANSDRQQYGNNRYSVSNIDQWLNSTASAGQWYSPQHDTDQSPNSTDVVARNPYDTDAGFLNGFDEQFISAIQDTTIIVARNTVTDGGGYDTLVRKLFLPSSAELFRKYPPTPQKTIITKARKVLQRVQITIIGREHPARRPRAVFTMSFQTVH